MSQKFVVQYHFIFPGIWCQNPSPSWSDGAWKRAFHDFHGNALEIRNSDVATTLSDPDRLSVLDFVKIHREMTEELGNEKAPEAAWLCLFSHLV